MNKRLEKASDVESIDEWWTRLKTSITESANENIGVKKGVKAKKDWITGKMLEKMGERRRWKSVNSVQGKKMYRKLNNELRRQTDKAREEWWKEECAELERPNRRISSMLCNMRSKLSIEIILSFDMFLNPHMYLKRLYELHNNAKIKRF